MERYCGLVKTIFLVIFLYFISVSCVDSFVWYGDHRHLFNQFKHEAQHTLPQPEHTDPTPFPFTFWRKRKRTSLQTQIFSNTKPKLRKLFIKDARLTKLSKIEKLLKSKVKSQSSKIDEGSPSVPYFKKYSKSKHTATKLLHQNYHKTNIPHLASGLLIDGTFYEINSQIGDSPKVAVFSNLLKTSDSDDEQRVIEDFEFPNLKSSQSAALKNTKQVKASDMSDDVKWYAPEKLDAAIQADKGNHQLFADGSRTLNSYVPSVESDSNTGQLGPENTRSASHDVAFGGFDSFLQDQSSQSFSDSTFDDLGPSGNTGFIGGGFDMDGSHCYDIDTRTCSTDRDCSCYGFYHCSINKCHLLDNLDVESDSDSTPIGTWYDEPRAFK
ncbi:hypothetical protein LOTGIDRAFT_158539 [Lottia gigantea]|uniref:Uncharacterized protein n=1 Tax=Lottia gigantea TaxID=225164 RepID=V4AWR2_LOTGI|nr:hypothetical protein LOTGIDRAFT_158539 [Lottia gigantea]ESO99455.1 hypothetical protein LOTGIDRAFT_158539 [Lottia gigantea]